MANSNDNICSLYQVLVQHRIYEGSLFWSRVQTLHAVQAGILAAGFTFRFAWSIRYFDGLILILGGALTLFLFFVVVMTYNDYAVNRDTIDELVKRILPDDMKQYKVRWSAERVVLSGHCVFYGIIIAFIILDFVLGMLFLGNPNLIR
ncbi:MAG: hypothetical protein A2Z28_06520 [Chloroflexi bacterium RBG_16_51_9]|nr:MAG: hypothetical protein A2Z28_06520 [Chloroflexi bacterium RBG_16_51_9]